MSTKKTIKKANVAKPFVVRSLPPSSAGRRDQAKRWALNEFERWNNVTGFVPEHTGYYYEIQGLIEDAAEIGFGVAHGASLRTIKNIIGRAE